jgi:diguanylate cyclase (GGDEF)-like protein/PAS domain S-box-containing protein
VAKNDQQRNGSSTQNPYGTPGFVRQPRDVLIHPVNLIPIPVWILFLVGRYYGFIANEPAWLLFGAIFAAQAITMGFALACPPGTDRARPVLHLGVEIVVIGLAMYVTGWGSVLCVGLVFATVGHMGVDGSRMGRWAMVFSVVTIVAGEVAISLGWLKTLIPEPQGHGLALLEVTGLCAVIWIMTFSQREKEQMDAELRNSEARLSALVQHASDAIVVIELDGTAKYASPAIQRLLGFDVDNLPCFDADLVHPSQLDYAADVFAEVRAESGNVAWMDLQLKRSDGEYRWCEIGVTNLLDDPSIGGFVCNMRDISERRNAQEELTFQAHHDALTLLPNRWYFLERLEQAQRAARADGGLVAVLFLDVDRFKLINDSLGHEIGDRLLLAVSERLAASLRPGDVVARFGGDEFTVLLTDVVDSDTALLVCERIIEAMREPVVIEGHELFISSSVGLALSSGGAEQAGDLLRQADLAMYVAKEKGRGRWELFDPSFAPHVIERLELEGDLWRALEHGELLVHFQPEVELRSGNVVSSEALLRWQHPRKGMLDPDSFIPLAEESSLIVAIDRFVLREACQWARRWTNLRTGDEPLVVSVNLSPRFMRQAEVVTEVTAVLRETGVDPRCIQLEITERSALTDLETTCAQLHQLRALGVRVAVDDFGTGYSSLSYLKQLPIDVLKLDKSFVDGLEGGAADLAIVQAIVTMGHALGVKVTAEGVERQEQAARLRDLGCDAAMGWLWSKAVPAHQLASIAEAGFRPDGGAREGVVLELRKRA